MIRIENLASYAKHVMKFKKKQKNGEKVLRHFFACFWEEADSESNGSATFIPSETYNI